MPTLRKLSPDEIADDDLELAPFALDALLARIAGADRTGLTRIDRPGAAGGEHAWRARVYVGTSELHRQFADSLHGGVEPALRAAVAWRDAQRTALPPKSAKPARPWRIARAEYDRLCGWLAYADVRRYFADGKYGGQEGARCAAEAWLAERREEQECSTERS
ncbi:MAG: hypothetical protein IPO81_00235 [Kouleothrix sp.]|nr:hypothetical protein [Kouleothrix sp.]